MRRECILLIWGKKKIEGENLEPNPRKWWLEGAN
jgi:hypothetical protein